MRRQAERRGDAGTSARESADSRRSAQEKVVGVVTELARQAGMELEIAGADTRCPRCTADPSTRLDLVRSAAVGIAEPEGKHCACESTLVSSSAGESLGREGASFTTAKVVVSTETREGGDRVYYVLLDTAGALERTLTIGFSGYAEGSSVGRLVIDGGGDLGFADESRALRRCTGWPPQPSCSTR